MGFMTEETRNSRIENRESRRRIAEIEGKAAMGSGERARAASEFQSVAWSRGILPRWEAARWRVVSTSIQPFNGSQIA